MVTFGPAEILFALLLWLLLSLIAGMFLAWGWILQQLLLRRPILPERPMVVRRQTPWRGGTVSLVVLAYFVVSFEISAVYMLATGRFPATPPPVPKAATGGSRAPHQTATKPVDAESGEATTKAPAVRPAPDGQPRPTQPAATTAGEVKAPPATSPRAEPAGPRPAISMIETMAVFLVTSLLLLVLLPWIARMTSGATLRDFGLSFEGWWRQAAVGIVAALAAAPLVYSVQMLATRIWEFQAHPVQTMLLKEFSLGVAGVAFVSAVIMAPMFEELLFRGILQSWLVSLLGRRAPVQPPQRPAPMIELAGNAATPGSWEPNIGYWEADGQNGPAAQTPGEPNAANDAASRSGWLAIIVTSLVFGALHKDQWPAPIPLFFLALVIGTVYHRTGSLIAAIVIHATFNGLSTLAMFTALLAPQVVDFKNEDAPKIAPAPIGGHVPIERAWMHRFPDRAKGENSS